jgi:putative sigma-54 modulation protein
MQLAVTFRHLEPSDAIKEYAKEKVDRIRKYFPDPIHAHVVLATERGFHHVADVNIQLHNGIVIKGHESTEDMYSSIDLVMAKIERQVRRYKERIRHHKPTSGAEVLIRHAVYDAASVDRPALSSAAPESTGAGAPESTGAGAPGASAAGPAPRATGAQPPQPLEQSHSAPKVIESSESVARPMSVDEAVMTLNLMGSQVVVFTLATTGEIAVVYRRPDGHYGLVNTGHGPDFKAAGSGSSGS